MFRYFSLNRTKCIFDTLCGYTGQYRLDRSCRWCLSLLCCFSLSKLATPWWKIVWNFWLDGAWRHQCFLGQLGFYLKCSNLGQFHLTMWQNTPIINPLCGRCHFYLSSRLYRRLSFNKQIPRIFILCILFCDNPNVFIPILILSEILVALRGQRFSDWQLAKWRLCLWRRRVRLNILLSGLWLSINHSLSLLNWLNYPNGLYYCFSPVSFLL